MRLEFLETIYLAGSSSTITASTRWAATPSAASWADSKPLSVVEVFSKTPLSLISPSAKR